MRFVHEWIFFESNHWKMHSYLYFLRTLRYILWCLRGTRVNYMRGLCWRLFCLASRMPRVRDWMLRMYWTIRNNKLYSLICLWYDAIVHGYRYVILSELQWSGLDSILYKMRWPVHSDYRIVLTMWATMFWWWMWRWLRNWNDFLHRLPKVEDKPHWLLCGLGHRLRHLPALLS